MHSILTLFSLLFLMCPVNSSATCRIKADDSRIIYTGRVLDGKGSVSFDWSGVTAAIEFEGTSLSLEYEDSKCNWINVWIDRKPDHKADTVIRLGGKEVLLAANLPDGRHRVTVQKRTEGEQGRLTFKTFTTDGKFIKAGKMSDRLMEFIGDSYTCGYGTESLSGKEHFKPSTENCNLTYAAILGRAFGCDVRLISHSGRGVVRNYGGYSDDKPMYIKYPQMFDCDTSVRWKPSAKDIKPRIVVIYLGTNDFSCGEHPSLEQWCTGYRSLISQVRNYYGEEVPILCMAPKADKLLPGYIREALEGCVNVHMVTISDKVYNDSSDLGADEHPSYEGHRKVALSIMPYISTLTGWELPEIIR